jgi:hypothetical protein
VQERRCKVNKQKLKGKLVENNVTHKELAAEDCMNYAECTVSQKINGTRPMYLGDANAIARKLNLSAQEYYDIFFGV